MLRACLLGLCARRCFRSSDTVSPSKTILPHGIRQAIWVTCDCFLSRTYRTYLEPTLRSLNTCRLASYLPPTGRQAELSLVHNTRNKILESRELVYHNRCANKTRDFNRGGLFEKAAVGDFYLFHPSKQWDTVTSASGLAETILEVCLSAINPGVE